MSRPCTPSLRSQAAHVRDAPTLPGKIQDRLWTPAWGSQSLLRRVQAGGSISAPVPRGLCGNSSLQWGATGIFRPRVCVQLVQEGKREGQGEGRGAVTPACLRGLRSF